MNKKAGLIKFVFIVIIIIILFYMVMKYVNADISNIYVNVTVEKVNESVVILNISSNQYFINGSNFSYFVQNVILTNINVTYFNSTNVTSIVSCNNSTFQVSCNCANSACNLSDGVNLSSGMQELFFNHYTTELKQKIEDSTNAMSENVIFRLEPTKVLLESYKQQAFNASLLQIEAERQRDFQLEQNKRIASQLNDKERELKWVLAGSLSMMVIWTIFIVFFFGYAEMSNKWGDE